MTHRPVGAEHLTTDRVYSVYSRVIVCHSRVIVFEDPNRKIRKDVRVATAYVSNGDNRSSISIVFGVRLLCGPSPVCVLFAVEYGKETFHPGESERSFVPGLHLRRTRSGVPVFRHFGSRLGF